MRAWSSVPTARTGAQHLATGGGADDLAELVDGEVLDAATQVLDLVRRAHRVERLEAQPHGGQQLHLVEGPERLGAEDQLVRPELDQPDVLDERHHQAEPATQRAAVPARALDESGVAGRDIACAEHQHHQCEPRCNDRQHCVVFPPFVPAGPRGPRHVPDTSKGGGSVTRAGTASDNCRIGPF
jgi:hypothetical protein